MAAASQYNEQIEKEQQVKQQEQLKNETASNAGQICPTPKDKDRSVCKNFSFGTAGNGSTSMYVYFSDGKRDYAITPAKYFTVLKEITGAENRRLDSITVPLFTNKASTNGLNKVTSQYAKVILEYDDNGGVNSEDAKKGTRILLCELERQTKDFTTYENTSCIGMRVSSKKFKDVQTYLYTNTHSLNVMADKVNKEDF